MTRSGRRTHRGQKPRICTPLHSRFVVSVLIALLLTGDFSGILQVEAQRNNQLRSTRASFSPRQPNVVPGGTTTFVEPPDESSGAYPSYPLNHTLDAYPQVLSNGPANWDFEAAAYEVGSRPGNSDFETAPSTVDTPTNWDFSAGSLTGWTVSGTVNASAGGPDGYYAAFSNSGTNTLTSSAFTVSAGADFLQYVISNGSLTVTVLYGGSYASRTSLGTKTCTSPCSWKLFSSNISTWSGQSIKLEFKRGAGGGSPYLDRVRTVTYGSGWLVGGDADFQSYGGSTWLGGSQAVTTPAITIDANAQYLTFQALKTTSGTVQRQVYIRSGAGYATETAIGGFYVSGPDVVNTYRVPIYPWAGQSIKLVIGEFASGYVYLDNIGVQMVVAPDWTFADPVYSRMLSNELTNGAVEQDGALAVDGSDPGNVLSLKGDDDVISSPYAIPSGAQSLLLQVRKGYFGTGHTATNLTVKILSGAGYATVTNLMPTGPRSISVDDWEYLVLPINAFAGQTVKLRLEANYIVLLNDVGFTGSVVPGWQVLGDSDAVTVRYDAISGTYLQAQDTTKKFSVSSSMTSIGILPGGSATDGRSISIGYSFGADSLSQVKIYWVAVMNGIDQTPVLITTKTAASASDTDYKDDRF